MINEYYDYCREINSVQNCSFRNVRVFMKTVTGPISNHFITHMSLFFNSSTWWLHGITYQPLLSLFALHSISIHLSHYVYVCVRMRAVTHEHSYVGTPPNLNTRHFTSLCMLINSNRFFPQFRFPYTAVRQLFITLFTDNLPYSISIRHWFSLLL